VIRGAIVSESLLPGTKLPGHGLMITSLARYEVGTAAPWQPPVWTLIEFVGPDDQSEELAAGLSSTLATPGWYANFYSESESFVIFAGRVFRYARGNLHARQEVEAYGRAHGVPEPQLDWAD
jgi:hypothetical protein